MGRQATVPKAEIPSEPLPAANGDKPKEQLSLLQMRERAEKLCGDVWGDIVEQISLTESGNEAIGEYLKGAIEKRDDLAELIFALDKEAERLKEMEQRIYSQRKRYERAYDLLRFGIRVQLENQGVKRVDGYIHRFSIRDGYNRVVIDDKSLLPPEMINWEPIPDKDAISKALHAGATVPGAHLEHGDSILTIK